MQDKKTNVIIIVLLLISIIVLAEFGPPEDVQITKQISKEEQSYWDHDLILKITTISVLVAFAVILFNFVQRKKWLRPLYLISSIVIIGFFGGGYLCPVSAVQNILFKAGTAYLILFLIPLVSTAIFGRFYCGYVCPFGGLSELLHIKKWRITINRRWDRILKAIKYVILIVLVLRIFLGGEALTDLTPFKALFTFGGSWLNWALTGLFVGLSIFFYRPFCKYLCPYGALMAVISRFSLFKIKHDDNCIDCSLCIKKCPMDAMGKDIHTNSECILCGDCCQNCPKDSLSVNIKK